MKPFHLLALGLLVTLAFEKPVFAQINCQLVQHRQFDFWLDKWLVKDIDEKKLLGTDNIEKTLYGCAIEEHFRDTGDGEGKSLSFYEPRNGLWHQTYLDNAGAVLQLSGGFEAEQMRMSGTVLFSGSSRPILIRITWKKIETNKVRVYQESSSSTGNTWTIDYDLIYVRMQ
jgi:hypothetical protein